MRREDLEHLIRAAGAISGSKRIVVIGSQAILGQFPYDAPERATLSMEADLLPLDEPDMYEMLTGSLGELSPFHDTFGYYGDGVTLRTATLPRDWQSRLVTIENANTNGYVGLCLEVHDLLVSKYLAGREKDREYCVAVARDGLADQATLLARLAQTDVEATVRAHVERQVAADYAGR